MRHGKPSSSYLAGRGLVAVVLAAFVLSACGKVGPIKPPEGQESSYRYPKTYPAPESVLPAPQENQASDDPAQNKTKAYETLNPQPGRYDPLSTTSKTYGPKE